MRSRSISDAGAKTRERSVSGVILVLTLLLLIGLAASPAWSETPAPSVHWGSMAFPDQYSLLNGGLTINRFTPRDGLGNRYDSTVDNTLGFNFATLSWISPLGRGLENWSTNLTLRDRSHGEPTH